MNPEPRIQAAPIETPQTIAFLIVPQFSMLAFVSAVEPLRVANRLAGRELYRWSAEVAEALQADAVAESESEAESDSSASVQEVEIELEGEQEEEQEAFLPPAQPRRGRPPRSPRRAPRRGQARLQTTRRRPPSSP